MALNTNELHEKRILISGGAGFLGRYLIEEFKDCEVVVVDDFSTSVENSLPLWAKTVKERVEEFKANERFHIVIHMAARPSPDDYIAHPIDAMLSNSIGTYNMLEVARKSDAIFLYTSSSEVYGMADVVPTPESYWGWVNPLGQRACYDESKRFSEALAISYYRQYGLDVRVQRIFNVYGPRLRGDAGYGRVVSRFITQALMKEDLTVHGDGMQTRSFLYVRDWVEATLLMLTRKNLRGEALNIGSNEEVRIIDLAKMIITLTGSNSKVRFVNGRPDDPKKRAADISKAKRLLGWWNKTSLHQGLTETIKWFKGHL